MLPLLPAAISSLPVSFSVGGGPPRGQHPVLCLKVPLSRGIAFSFERPVCLSCAGEPLAAPTSPKVSIAGGQLISPRWAQWPGTVTRKPSVNGGAPV